MCKFSPNPETECRAHIPDAPPRTPRIHLEEIAMTWEKPTATNFRFGFEITMYIANR